MLTGTVEFEKKKKKVEKRHKLTAKELRIKTFQNRRWNKNALPKLTARFWNRGQEPFLTKKQNFYFWLRAIFPKGHIYMCLENII